jgi:hypothetical protein
VCVQNPYVKSQLINWIRTLMDYGFDGLRIDTVPEIEPGFWVDFVSAANTYAVLPLPIPSNIHFPSNSAFVDQRVCGVCGVRVRVRCVRSGAGRGLQVGEVFSDLSCCATYQKQALPGVLSYPLFWTLRSVFQQKQSMNQLQVGLPLALCATPIPYLTHTNFAQCVCVCVCVCAVCVVCVVCATEYVLQLPESVC